MFSKPQLVPKEWGQVATPWPSSQGIRVCWRTRKPHSLADSGTFLLRCDVPSTDDIRAFSRDDTNAGLLGVSAEHGNDDGIDGDVL